MINIRRRRDFRRWQHRIQHVYLNGVDVTHDCWKVDTRRGRVWLFVRGADGTVEAEPRGIVYRRNRRTGEMEKHVRPMRPRTEVRLGHVQVIARPQWSAADVRRWFRLPMIGWGKRGRRAAHAFERRLLSKRISVRIQADDQFSAALRRIIERLDGQSRRADALNLSSATKEVQS